LEVVLLEWGDGGEFALRFDLHGKKLPRRAASQYVRYAPLVTGDDLDGVEAFGVEVV